MLVHGGGDEVSALQAALGGSATFVDGRRVTTRSDIDIVRMALSGSANKRLVATLVGSGIDAVGLSGEDAALIAASPIDVEQLGYVGVPTTDQRRISATSACRAAICRSISPVQPRRQRTHWRRR